MSFLMRQRLLYEMPFFFLETFIFSKNNLKYEPMLPLESELCAGFLIST